MTHLNFCEAIARMEGWLKLESRCRRNHNPGDIEWGAFAQSRGATHGDPRFAVFPDDATGFAAMAALFRAKYVGMTLSAAIAKYAPPDENDTANYIKDVSAWTGIGEDEVLTNSMFG